VNVAPVNVSVSPNSGSSAAGTARLFTTVYADTSGANDITQAYLRVGNSSANALFGYYNAVTNKLYLLNDANSAWLGGFAPGSANVISNRQGSLDCANTTVSQDGNNLTVNWSLTPKAAFAGPRSLFLYVRDTAGLTDGYDKLGEWSIVASS
ncbi:MAG TPA: hypothetical protein VNA16_05875, partial [Abditibacteriaceae bacterium]|nr:hypothetical protein [Abditibacteriaceae bacterium]